MKNIVLAVGYDESTETIQFHVAFDTKPPIIQGAFRALREYLETERPEETIAAIRLLAERNQHGSD